MEGTFSPFFELRASLKKNKKCLTSVHLFWQKNISTYSYFVSKPTLFDISRLAQRNNSSGSVFKEEVMQTGVKKRKRMTLELDHSGEVDVNSNLRTVFSGVFHSLDAAVAVRVRLKMRELYQTDVFTVHDSFCCEARYVDQVKVQYKAALFSEVFDKTLSDILKIEGFDFSSFEKQIVLNKQRPEWQALRESFSPFCLKLD